MNRLLFKLNKNLFATLALAEHNGKTLSKNTMKLLSAAKFLKDETHLLVCGKASEQLMKNISETVGKSITKIYCTNTDKILTEEIAYISKDLITKNGYKNVLGLSSSYGKDLIPRLAGYFVSQPISDVAEILDANTFVRPTYAGNALTKVKSTQNINFLTVRSSNFQEIKPESSNPVFQTVSSNNTCKTQFVKEEVSNSNKPELTTARIVISGGRGVKSKQNFALINDLADAFGDAAVGASRAAVDSGFCPNELQVGQTGKVVAPELYIAVGISGAVQHLAGMKDSKVIVAINNRPDEAIFEIANYGLEADLFKAVPELIEKIKKLKGK